MVLGGKRMKRLLHSRDALPADAPYVTVLVPAKDEGEPIRQCIESILAQDYPRVSIIAIDDRSTDNTGKILDELSAAHHGKFVAIRVPEGGLPQGWLGKCHALHVGARQAAGEWLLFIDSDVRLLRPDAIARAVALSVNRSYDALSILTRLDCDSLFEKLVLPLAAGTWSIMHAISFTNDDNRTNDAYANGQFFLVRKTAYDGVGGHESVRSCITEDVELMRALKLRGAKTRFLLGNTLAATRMHASFRQMLKGWGRIFSGTARRKPYRIIGAMLFIMLCGLSAYPAIVWGLWESHASAQITPWLVASAAHLGLLTLVLADIYAASGNPRRNALLFPWAGVTLLALLGFALKCCITGKIEWRGTVFDQNISKT